jgi:hypothetical protein
MRFTKAAFTIGAVLATAYGAIRMVQKYSGYTGLAGAPFPGLTAHRAEYLNCSRDNLVPTALSTRRLLYMAPSGELAETVEHVNSKDKSVIRFIHAKGESMQIYENLQIYNVIRQGQFRPESTMKRLGDPSSECAATIDGRANEQAGRKIGEETLLGYRTIKYYRSNGPAGNRTTWLAPELGCFAVQTETVWAPGRSGSGSCTLQVTERIQVGAPAPSAFEPPPTFRQVKPSETIIESFKARLRAAGVAESEIPPRVLAMRAADREALDHFDSLSTK